MVTGRRDTQSGGDLIELGFHAGWKIHLTENRERKMAVTGAGLEGIVAAESSICFIDGDEGILSYCGFNIHVLAEKATFEEVIFLLWNGRLPKQAELDTLRAALVANRPIPAEVTAFLKGAGKALPMDVLRTAVSMLSLYDPEVKDTYIE